jgi:23S rRNA (adenine-N6)-dimethyltransferase
LVARVPRRPDVPVLEIGAGSGVLTAALKDARLLPRLRARVIGRTNVECHHADILTAALPEAPYIVVANAPFGITSAILRKLLDAPTPPQAAWLIVQREAAEKFAGVPRETLFSLQRRPWFDIRIAARISRDAFEPRPRVSAALLHIQRREDALVSASDARAYRSVTAAAFGAASLRVGLRPYVTRRQFARLAREMGISPSSRAPDVTFDQWLRIFRFIAHQCSGRDPATQCVDPCMRSRRATLGHNLIEPSAPRSQQRLRATPLPATPPPGTRARHAGTPAMPRP